MDECPASAYIRLSKPDSRSSKERFNNAPVGCAHLLDKFEYRKMTIGNCKYIFTSSLQVLGQQPKTILTCVKLNQCN